MDLPKDIIHIILSNLSSKNRSETCTVSKDFYHDILDYSKTIWPNFNNFYNNINDYHLLMRLKNTHIMQSQIPFTTNDIDVVCVACKYHKKITPAIITASKYGHLNIIKYLLNYKNIRLEDVSYYLFRDAIKYKYIDVIDFLLECNVKYEVIPVCLYADLELAKRLFYIKQTDCPVNFYAFVLQNKDEDAVKYMTACLHATNNIDLECAIQLVTESKSILAVDRLLSLGVDVNEIYEWARENNNQKIINYLNNIKT